VPGLIYQANDNLLRACGVSTIDATGKQVFLTGTATVAVTMTDNAGVPLAGEVWPVRLDYVPASQGEFLGVIRDSVLLPPAGSTVKARLVIDNGADQHGELTGVLTVQDRLW
jgi:hypothetical protein